MKKFILSFLRWLVYTAFTMVTVFYLTLFSYSGFSVLYLCMAIASAIIGVCCFCGIGLFDKNISKE